MTRHLCGSMFATPVLHGLLFTIPCSHDSASTISHRAASTPGPKQCRNPQRIPSTWPPAFKESRLMTSSLRDTALYHRLLKKSGQRASVPALHPWNQAATCHFMLHIEGVGNQGPLPLGCCLGIVIFFILQDKRSHLCSQPPFISHGWQNTHTHNLCRSKSVARSCPQSLMKSACLDSNVTSLVCDRINER